jgi:hypothetical protein
MLLDFDIWRHHIASKASQCNYLWQGSLGLPKNKVFENCSDTTEVLKNHITDEVRRNGGILAL